MEYYLSPQGSNLGDYFGTYPQYYASSWEIDTKSKDPTATFSLSITYSKEWDEDSYELCYLETDLDPEMDYTPVGGFKVIDNEWS